jgi:hypothetical protein
MKDLKMNIVVKIIIYIGLLLIASCGERNDEEKKISSYDVTSSLNSSDAKSNSATVEARFDDKAKSCAIKTKPLCSYSVDGLTSNACNDFLWMGYCYNTFVDRGILDKKTDMSGNDELLELMIKIGMVKESMRDTVNKYKTDADKICVQHTISKDDFASFLARIRESTKTYLIAIEAQNSCIKKPNN